LRLPWGPLLLLTGLIVAAVFADVLAPYEPLSTSLKDRFQPPVLMGGTWAHPFGTDDAGRDILSRVIFGARLSLLVAGTALLIGTLAGTTLGLISGFFGGAVDAVIMRVADIVISYPVMLLAMFMAVALGPQPSNVVISIALILWARFARVVRSEVLSLRERDYVALARIAGASPLRIMLKHLLPNFANTVLVLSSLELGWAIVVEAALSFLGAGIPPPEPAWGSMVAQGREYLTNQWWVSMVPAVAIMMTVLSLNLLGDWLRDALDPRLRQL